MRDRIRQLVSSIRPFDELEAAHLASTIAWIDSGAELCRIEKPATPPKHLVSYFVLIDPRRRKLLLIDHIKAGLWLPAGGHVERHEHPNATVEREIQEELNIAADFASSDPLFITQTVTVGMTAGHTDVSLWYVLKADSNCEIAYDPEEFNGYRWFGYDEILGADISTLDPHMHRFSRKLFASDLVRA